MGTKAKPGDGVLGGSVRVAGHPTFCFAQDSGYAGGSLGAQHAETIVRVQRLARRARGPVIGFVESGGARMQEGPEALHGHARLFSQHVALSGPGAPISAITRTPGGGGPPPPPPTDLVGLN